MRDTNLDDGKDTILRKDLGFQATYFAGLFLLCKEASAQGLLAEYEDLVDTLYSMFPSKHKRSIQIYNEDLEEMNPVYIEWNKAKRMGPQMDNERIHEDSKLKVQVRSRCLRKAQIVTDLAQHLKLLGEEFDNEVMGEDSDVLKMVNEYVGQL